MKRAIAAVCVVAAVAGGVVLAQEKKQDRETKVRSDRKNVEGDEAWIYDDLPRGVAEAKKSGKPLLVVFRCIPCEACAQLDEDVVERDPIVKSQLDKFVCVRIPHANGMDLSVFQFDYDQSWAAFMLNADMTIYGRYGTRSHQTKSEDDVSLEGFSAALEGALALHSGYPANQGALAGKRGAKLPVAAPEEYPSLKGKFTSSLDWEGKVVQSCMHCHMVGEAQRLELRSQGKPIPDSLLFAYPHPKVLGLAMDPKRKARVSAVAAGSSAEKDGFRAGDDITSLAGQPILSIADVQWVLQGAGDEAALEAHVVRGGETVPLKLTLAAGWRRRGDIDWRVSSWDLRRMTTGGMLLETVPAEDRAKLGFQDSAMALRAKHVGQHGEHAAAKNAGFKQGDVVIALNGRNDVKSETEWMTWLVNAKKPGDKVRVTVLRGGEKLELTLPMQ